MNLNSQLKQIQRNRTKADRTEALRAPLGRWLDSLAPAEDLQGFYDAIGPEDAGEFRRYCRIAEVRGDTLVVRVSQPSLVAVMRARWQGTLHGALRGAARRVRFECDRLTDDAGARAAWRPTHSNGHG